MKKTLTALGILTLLVTAVSFSVARWSVHCAMSQPAVNLNDAAWLKHALNLTDAQAPDVEKAETEFRTQLNSFCAAHCSARMALGDELAKSSPDPAKCGNFIEKMNAMQADAERVTLAHILKVRALLNEQQAQRYATMIHDQVCSLPMGSL
jgi:Spy/CpxP family protein refolding chaperone